MGCSPVCPRTGTPCAQSWHPLELAPYSYYYFSHYSYYSYPYYYYFFFFFYYYYYSYYSYYYYYPMCVELVPPHRLGAMRGSDAQLRRAGPVWAASAPWQADADTAAPAWSQGSAQGSGPGQSPGLGPGLGLGQGWGLGLGPG